MKPASEWRRLDNAAKIFPPTSTARDPKVFRFVCELNEAIQPDALARAAEQTLSEFPFFRYTLRHGVFWYYLEDSGRQMLPVLEEQGTPCEALYLDAASPLYRISYWGQRINLEVYHVLTDGAGALEFLRALTCHYLQETHTDALRDADLSLGFDASAWQRARDSFDKYYTGKTGGRAPRDPKAYRIKSARLPHYGLRVVLGEMPVDVILKEARARGTTVTVLLGACLLCAVAEEMAVRDRKKPVVVTVPVNLRNFFASDTARNFFSVVNLGVDFSCVPCELPAVIEALTSTMRERLTREYLQNRLNRLASLEHNPFVRILPLALKDPIMHQAGRMADAAATVSLSNVGKVTMPEALAPYIRKFDIFIATGDLQICSCSYGNILSVGLTSSFQATDIERHFFRMLAALGLPITIATNMEGMP